MAPREILDQLYRKQKLSMMQIASRLGTTHATVLYWLKRYRIERRSWSESMYVKRNPKGDPFFIPTQLGARQRALMQAGLLLYWAEGRKQGGSVQLGNLDPRMLQLFIKFLREVRQVPVNRIRISVRVYKVFPLEKARSYWASALRLPRSRVLVYRHTDGRSKFGKQWSRYGIATPQFHSSKFKGWLDSEMEQRIGNLLRANCRNATKYPKIQVKLCTKLLRDGPFIIIQEYSADRESDLEQWVVQDAPRRT